MIDLNRCGTCELVCPLIETGLDITKVVEIASAASFGAEVICTNGPETTEGGWQRCDLADFQKAGLRGAVYALRLARSEQTIEVPLNT
jgi:hypothetical protein